MTAPRAQPDAPTGPLDTALAVETPEGVALELRPAGVLPRAIAWLIDSLIRAAVYVALAPLVPVLGGSGAGLFLLVAFALEWFYPVIFEVWRGGATPGKSALGLVVVSDDGTPVSLRDSLTRNFLRWIDFLPMTYAAGVATMMCHPGFKRLGDLAAGTLVVFDDRAKSAAHRLPGVAPVHHPVPLELDEQRALIAFAERAPGLNAARARELALEAGVLVERAEDPVERLFGMAAWYTGRRE